VIPPDWTGAQFSLLTGEFLFSAASTNPHQCPQPVKSNREMSWAAKYRPVGSTECPSFFVSVKRRGERPERKQNFKHSEVAFEVPLKHQG
jgi:hypothetical protein